MPTEISIRFCNHLQYWYRSIEFLLGISKNIATANHRIALFVVFMLIPCYKSISDIWRMKSSQWCLSCEFFFAFQTLTEGVFRCYHSSNLQVCKNWAHGCGIFSWPYNMQIEFSVMTNANYVWSLCKPVCAKYFYVI